MNKEKYAIKQYKFYRRKIEKMEDVESLSETVYQSDPIETRHFLFFKGNRLFELSGHAKFGDEYYIGIRRAGNEQSEKIETIDLKEGEEQQKKLEEEAEE